MRRLSNLLLGLLAVLLSAGVASAASDYSQNWDDGPSGAAGWIGVDSNVSTTYQATGGNGGGYLRTSASNTTSFDDTGGRTLSNVPELVGDYSATAWTLNFDILLEAGVADAAMFRLRGTPPGQGWVVDLGALPTLSGGWTTYTVMFDGGWSEAQARANGWLPDNQHPILHPDAGDSNSWADTIAAVASFSIRVSGEAETLSLGIDNVTLVSGPSTAVPEPSTATLIGLGLALLAGRRAAGREVA